MIQKFEIPIYLVLSKYIYDESNEYAMEGYSFDKDEAMKILKGKVMKFAREHQVDAVVPDWCSDETVWEVGNYGFTLEERSIEV